MSHRRSGIMVPLFSLVSTGSWGVGEFRDLPVFARWLRRAGQSFVQILPILEIPEAETSPYSALTAMALDPIYISLPALEDFQALGGEGALDETDRETLRAVQAAPSVRYRLIRSMKSRWLRRSHERFLRDEAGASTARAARFAAFARAESSWLDDYALFQAARGLNALRAWWEWPEPLARRRPDALSQAERELAPEIAYRKYVQWVAAEQWAEARRASAPIQVCGDLPFTISGDSPDVWTCQEEFRLDATVGVPPDAFSETGQDWGLPPWRWEAMQANDFGWLRRRARRSAALCDSFRIDHLVGLYRTFVRPIDKSKPPFFAPRDEPTQLALGERLVRLYQESGAEIIAEDLGSVPDFVRASLARLGVPGFKVFRWERHWSVEGQPFVEPQDYPEVSVATSGTHDTEPLTEWWETLPPADRAGILALPSIRRALGDRGPEATSAPPAGLTPALSDALLRALVSSGSRLVILPIIDLFDLRDRINTPAEVNEENWTWRLPWPVDQLETLDQPRERADTLREWTRDAQRE